MTVENALSKSFKKIVKLQLEPVWHQVSPYLLLLLLLNTECFKEFKFIAQW